MSERLLPAPGVYAFDPVHTFVAFAARHKVVGMVRGRFDDLRGSVMIDDDPASCSVELSIEASSIDTRNRWRDDDLRGDDFFDAARYQTIRYAGTGFAESDGTWSLSGNLTIRAITQVIPVQFTYRGTLRTPGQPDRLGFHCLAATRREDFGMTRDLLDEIGVRAADPDVWIEVDVEALSAEDPKTA